MRPRPAIIANRLRPSPILHSLKYSLRWSNSSSLPGTAHQPVLSSELQELNSIISKSPNLKLLDLSLVQAAAGQFLGTDVPLPLISGYQFPQLKSITIPAQWSWIPIAPEVMPQLTCALLNHAAQWNHISQLKLIGFDPKFTFEHLQGSVPNLKQLEMALQHSEFEAADFISSINGLKELRITNYKSGIQLDVLCAAIVKHQASLTKLVFHTPMDYHFQRKTPFWQPEQLGQLLDFKFSHLEMDVKLEEATWVISILIAHKETENLTHFHARMTKTFASSL